MTGSIPWILVTLIILIIVLLIFFLKRKNVMKQPTDYKTFFIMGIIFFVMGLANDTTAFWMIGLVYILVGLANKNKWGIKHTPSKKEIQTKKYLMMGLLIFFLLGIGLFVVVDKKPILKVTNFEECLAAGNPAMESYPRQCIHKDQHFVEDITWKNDGVELRQHKTELNYGCFGCNMAKGEPALCVDPIPDMISVPESPGRYCDNDFNIIEP